LNGVFLLRKENNVESFETWNKSSFSMKYGELEKPRVYYIFKNSSAA
jgi:hypothetical protein